jgi:hypothetical protein
LRYFHWGCFSLETSSRSRFNSFSSHSLEDRGVGSPQAFGEVPCSIRTMSSVAMNNSASGTPTLLPRDARLIALLLAANGAEDCEEGVVRMLVEFAHRKSATAV